MFVNCFCQIVCHIRWIQGRTLHTLSLIMLTLIQQQKGPKMQPLCAHQHKYTLLHSPEVCQKALKYRYLHIMNTQQWSQRYPAPLYNIVFCSHLY